jgi:hypothetical protein
MVCLKGVTLLVIFHNDLRQAPENHLFETVGALSHMGRKVAAFISGHVIDYVRNQLVLADERVHADLSQTNMGFDWAFIGCSPNLT